MVLFQAHLHVHIIGKMKYIEAELAEKLVAQYQEVLIMEIIIFLQALMTKKE